MKTFIIDDDELSIFLTQHTLLLEDESFDVVTFLSAQEALYALEGRSDGDIPDIILLDLNMPIMNGWNFLSALEPIKTKLEKKCKIYILTSSLDASDMLKAEEYAIVSGFVHKPIESEDIQKIISEKTIS